MQNYILALSIASAVTIPLVAGLGLYAYASDQPLSELAKRKTWGYRVVVKTDETELLVFMGCFCLFNLAILGFINRYPLRIYRNADDYIAVFQGYLPFLRRQIKFSKGQVEPTPNAGFMPWKDVIFSINGKRSVLLEQYFKTPSELSRMIHEKYHWY